MSTLAITIIAIQSIIILLMAYPAWLAYMILSDRDVMANLMEVNGKINEFDLLSKHNQECGDRVWPEWSHDPSLTPKPFTDEERMALSETVRELHKLEHPSKHKTVQWPTRPVPMPYDEIVTIDWGKKSDVKGGKHEH